MSRRLLLILFFLFPQVCLASQMGNGTIINGLASDKLNSLVKMGGATFVKDYELLPVGEVTQSQLDADFAMGSKAATFTAARSASAPSTYVDANGVVQLVTTANTGRIRGGYYDTTGFHAQKGLMIEAAGTNLKTYSNADSTWDTNGPDIRDGGDVKRYRAYVESGAATTNTISTDSVYSRSISVQITNAGVGSDDIEFFNPTAEYFSLSNGTYALSFWVKATAAITTTVKIMEGNDDWTIYMSFPNLTTVANTWIRYTGTATHSAGNVTDARISIYLGNLGIFTILFDNFQLEASPYATSFIPTTTATLTRAAEVLKYEIAGNRTAATESILIKYAPFWSGASPTTANRLLASDTKDRDIALLASADSMTIYPNITDDATDLATQTLDPVINTSYVLGAVFQHASPYANIFSNGTSQGTWTTNDFTDPAWGTYFYIGSDNVGATQLSGIIQSVSIYNRALTAGEVLTATNTMNE